MYLQSAGALHHGARSILYDGSPFIPDLSTFVRLVGEQKYKPVSFYVYLTDERVELLIWASHHVTSRP